MPKIEEIVQNSAFDQLEEIRNDVVPKLKPIEDGQLREANGPKAGAAVPFTGFQFNVGSKTKPQPKEPEQRKQKSNEKETETAKTDENTPTKDGNDNEEELYTTRAKGFKYANNEWKDHGVGAVKIMRSKKNPSLKCVAFKNSIKDVFNFAIGKGLVFMEEVQKNRGIIRFTAILEEEVGPEKLTFKVNSAVVKFSSTMPPPRY